MPLSRLYQRTPTRIARLMLAWFVLALGVAAASPLIQPQVMQLVCSAGGEIRVLVDSGDGLVDAGHSHTLDCALCLLANAPPPALSIWQASHAHANAPGAAYVPEPVVASHGAPPPARGPPAFS